MAVNPFAPLSGFVQQQPPSGLPDGGYGANSGGNLPDWLMNANRAHVAGGNYLDPALAPRPEYTPFDQGFPPEFYAAQAAKYAAMTGTQVPTGPTMSAQPWPPIGGQPPAQAPGPAAPAPGAGAGGTFAPLLAQMNPSGFARPEASQWLQQAMSGQYLPGWGPPMKPGTPIGSVGTPGQPGAGGGTITNPPPVGSPTGLLAKDLVISPEAKKMAKKLKKMRSASQFGWDDALKVAGSVALGVATGGSTLAGQVAGGALAGGGALFGANAENKALGGNIKQYRKNRDAALTAAAEQLGWSKQSGKWRDASGADVTMPQMMQQLINMGVIGG